jgi:ABC-2 type transport system ATP-binding protein
MSEPSIVVQNVCRSYDNNAVLNDLSFTVQRGSIYGFLGRNGSGKTTTLRMLAGLTRPGEGAVRVLGEDPFFMRARDRRWLGYMSEKPMIPGTASVRSTFLLCRNLYPNWDAALADALLAKYGISIKTRVSRLSQGNQRLLAFIMAIAPRPKVLLLDEPAANLDVVARREILDDILQLLRGGDAAVLFSTHILSDVERVADEIGILAKGTLRISESLDTLKGSIRQVRFYDFPNVIPQTDIPDSFRTVRSNDEVLVTLRTGADPQAWARRWSCQYEERALNLEDIFVELSRN